jgi:hypothetical protein
LLLAAGKNLVSGSTEIDYHLACDQALSVGQANYHLEFIKYAILHL